jgi:hypothetical protein
MARPPCYLLRGDKLISWPNVSCFDQSVLTPTPAKTQPWSSTARLPRTYPTMVLHQRTLLRKARRRTDPHWEGRVILAGLGRVETRGVGASFANPFAPSPATPLQVARGPVRGTPPLIDLPLVTSRERTKDLLRFLPCILHSVSCESRSISSQQRGQDERGPRPGTLPGHRCVTPPS